MSGFAIRKPFLIIVACLVIAVVGITSVVRMPVDLFPPIRIPVVVVATFFSGMPPEQIETDITGRFERFFTLASNIEHIESRSLPGVSLIKIFFQPGTDADAALTNISNLAMADLRKLPPGTLPPVVLKFDASSLPVCLITLKGRGLNETQLRDMGQYNVRNQVANVEGASVPQPFGGRYRQIMVYVDPRKLEAHDLSPMDVVRAVNESNLILPAGDVKIGPYDYSLYTNSQLDNISDMNLVPVKSSGFEAVRIADIGKAEDAQQIQYNVVRVDGQPSVYLPVLKQGGDTNTISVVDGVKRAVGHLVDVPKDLVTRVVFDQSVFVKSAIETLLHEGLIGMFLTSVMILVFLGNFRATVAVFLSIPLSALATFIALSLGGGTVNTMVLGGLALVFSRVIDNSVVVLENIFRHLELGEGAPLAAEKGGREVAMAVLAATLTTAVVFFPVTFLYGVSKFLFTALAAAVILALFSSYFVAMTVVPLFCAKFLKGHEGHEEHLEGEKPGPGRSFNAWFNRRFESLLDVYSRAVKTTLRRPAAVVAGLAVGFFASLLLYPYVSVAFFPRTDAGQFMVNIKAPSGTRLEMTEQEVQHLEELIRRTIPERDLKMIVSNVGVTPGFSSIYTSNSAPHTAFVQVALNEDHAVGSYEYMDRVRHRIAEEMPELSAYFQSGGLVDAVLNLGLPAPIDVQVAGSDMHAAYNSARQIAAEIRKLPDVSDVFIPQDLDYPALRVHVDRARASQLGLTQKEVVSNIITALTSNQMIAPSFWVDPRSGNDYMLTVQYPETAVHSLADLKSIPVRAPRQAASTPLESVSDIRRIQAPTEVDHYQLRRTIDVYVSLKGEGLGRAANSIDRIIAGTRLPEGVTVDLRGMVQGMRASFRSFGLGLLLALLLLYLILV
ncbi:MAG TPA: efflux RND transporter permease subunit, partial [Bryobacteraceae bacterium]|nr:efflux RND transporter permease subunit [Bryobacteraceae bacterium]